MDENFLMTGFLMVLWSIFIMSGGFFSESMGLGKVCCVFGGITLGVATCIMITAFDG